MVLRARLPRLSWAIDETLGPSKRARNIRVFSKTFRVSIVGTTTPVSHAGPELGNVLANQRYLASRVHPSLRDRDYLILSDVLSAEFSAMGVQRLASFYDLERDLFRSLSPPR